MPGVAEIDRLLPDLDARLRRAFAPAPNARDLPLRARRSGSDGRQGTLVGLGAAGGLLYALLHRLVLRRRAVRSVLWGVALVLLTLRGLRPIQSPALEWFMPLALVYAAIVDIAYTTWSRHRARDVDPSRLRPARRATRAARRSEARVLYVGTPRARRRRHAIRTSRRHRRPARQPGHAAGGARRHASDARRAPPPLPRAPRQSAPAERGCCARDPRRRAERVRHASRAAPHAREDGSVDRAQRRAQVGDCTDSQDRLQK
jgi:hypothetical protein